jgi:hypothetical protein
MAKLRTVSKAQSGVHIPAEQNARRVGQARAALAAYRTEARIMETESFDATIGDLICDLIHLCDQEVVNFDRLLQLARMHHSAEVKERVADRLRK